MRAVFLLFIICALLYSCDCYQRAGGIVLDLDTHQPVGDVVLQHSKNELPGDTSYYHQHTDRRGRFSYSRITAYITGCPCTIYFYKKATKGWRQTINNIRRTIQFTSQRKFEIRNGYFFFLSSAF